MTTNDTPDARERELDALWDWPCQQLLGGKDTGIKSNGLRDLTKWETGYMTS